MTITHVALLVNRSPSISAAPLLSPVYHVAKALNLQSQLAQQMVQTRVLVKRYRFDEAKVIAFSGVTPNAITSAVIAASVRRRGVDRLSTAGGEQQIATQSLTKLPPK